MRAERTTSMVILGVLASWCITAAVALLFMKGATRE